jgi:hypothetical protein
MIFTPAFPAEPRQALGLLSSIALSSWRVRAIKIVCPKLRPLTLKFCPKLARILTNGILNIR